MLVPPGRRLATFITASVLAVLSCQADSATAVTGVLTPNARTPLPPLYDGTIAIIGVDVVTMESAAVLDDQTVVVRDGRIAELGPRGAIDVPADAERIDGTGRWLIPGLIDSHVHLRRGDLAAYRQAGITTVRNMWGHAAIEALREEVAAGAELPTIFSAGPGMDGNPPVWPGTIVLTDPTAARAAVRQQLAEGWDFIKVYNRLSPSVYDAILDEAHAVRITVIGHVPLSLSIDHASARGQASVEHLTGIAEAVASGRGPSGWLSYDPDDATRVARMLATRGVWVCPTLIVLRHLAVQTLSPADADRTRANQGAMVKALRDAGVPLLAGTDAGIDLVAPGALAGELELFVQAGLTPLDALRSATADAARFLGVDGELGTIAIGKRADLVLLGANPLDDVRALRGPVGVILRGRRLF
jgi:imidazolonepropionase-like amidohydrolase